MYIYIYICVCLCVCVCVCLCVWVLYQNCILLKDNRISPCTFSKKDLVSKAIGTDVSLHGATSKRASMWHSPVFTCIRPNRIPAKRINEQLSDTSKCRWIFHLTELTARCIWKNVYGNHYRYNNICGRQEANFSDLKIFILKSGKWQEHVRDLTNFQGCVSQPL